MTSFEHAGEVRAVRLTDAGMLLSASADGAVIVWDVHTRQQVHAFATARKLVGAAITRDAATIATTDGRTGFVWDVKSGEQRRKFKCESSILSFTDDASTLYTHDSFIAVATGKPRAVVTRPARAYAMDATGRALVAAYDVHDEPFYQLTGGGRADVRLELPGEAMPPTRVVLSAGMIAIVTEATGTFVVHWNDRGKQVARTRIPVDGEGNALALSSDGAFVLWSAYEAKAAILCDLAAKTATTVSSGIACSASFSADRRRLAIGAVDGCTVCDVGAAATR